MNDDNKLEPLMTDGDIASLVRMSDSWVRQQRSNRKHGRSHTLTIDPVYVNDSPRYRKSEVQRWFEEFFRDNAMEGEVT
jgi:hypothetical protein